ncbi:MAG TPA: ornithine carbamoyltransferase [Candidatus Binatia bacterium]|nr:ornithine carbamoyltransferase [Candidatus Binatia bacterium]
MSDAPPRTARHLLRLADLDAGSVSLLVDVAQELSERPLEEAGRLAGRTVVLFFNKPSTRTRVSFATAVVRLGGTPIAVGPGELQLGRGETIEDTARVISGYASAFVIRTYSDQEVRRYAAASSIPVINALTDGHHPCQAVGDLLTLRQLWGELDGHRLAYVGDGANVAHSLIEGCAATGVSIAVASPPGYAPDPEVVEGARAVAARSGTEVLITERPEEAVDGADCVYTDVWLSMGVPEGERAARTRAFESYRVTPELMAKAKPDCVFLHCLPAHRGEEVAAEVIDGPRSRVFQQAANRLPSAQAVLLCLITGRLTAAG